jgi:hypothetical protein
VPAKYLNTAAGPGPVRISSAVVANSANDRINLVREDIDSLLVTNRTPDVAGSHISSGSKALAFPGGIPNILVFLQP